MTAPYECWAWVEREESGQEAVVAARVDLPGAGATALPLGAMVTGLAEAAGSGTRGVIARIAVRVRP